MDEDFGFIFVVLDSIKASLMMYVCVIHVDLSYWSGVALGMSWKRLLAYVSLCNSLLNYK